MHSLARHARRPLNATKPCRRRFGSSAGVIRDLEERGFIADVTHRDALAAKAERAQLTLYSGIDPTAAALHVGHLVPLMALLHFHLRGHRIISLIGGATGLIGDPSGRKAERELAHEQAIQQNVNGLTSAVKRFFTRAVHHASTLEGVQVHQKADNDVQILNNLAWWKDMSMLRFLREVGSVNRVSTMLARESVQTRLASASGISFTEFSYQLLQAYDFHELRRTHNCTLQLGGSDQWGNIVAGIDLIHRLSPQGVHEAQVPDRKEAEPLAYGLTTPLLTTSSGEKFGKSAGNAIWLDEKQTSPFDFYQFWLRTADADVERYLKLFTLLPLSAITATMAEQRAHPAARPAQTLLAHSVSALVHGAGRTGRAQAITDALYGDVRALSAQEIVHALQGDARLRMVPAAELLGEPLMVLARVYGLTRSGGEAKTLAKAGGLYVNGKRHTDAYEKLQASDLLDGRVAVMRAGKKDTVVLAIEDEIPESS